MLLVVVFAWVTRVVFSSQLKSASTSYYKRIFVGAVAVMIVTLFLRNFHLGPNHWIKDMLNAMHESG